MNKQLSFAENGNIAPCPWASDCINYPTGCKGVSYWCKRFDIEIDRKQMVEEKKRWESIDAETTKNA